MSPNTLAKTEVSQLQKEVSLLRSFVIGFAGKDREGRYRPEFVRRVLACLAETSQHIFKDASSFLKQLRNAS